MKTRSMKALGTACAAMALVFGAARFRAAQHSPSYQFQEAIDLMETKGDYPAAIRVFDELAKGSDRNLAARSLLYVGLCYEKLGKDEAKKAYERVLRDYTDQSEAATEARTHLARLVGGNGSKTSELVARRVWAGPDVVYADGPSPDGRYLTYSDPETGDLAIRDIATGEHRRLTHNGSGSGEFALYGKISPDGKQVSYAWFNKSMFFELRIVGLDGSKPRVIYSNPEVNYVAPSGWSPDGKAVVAVFSRADGTNQMALVSTADDSARVLKTFDWRYPGHMCFSPDGRYIAYDFPPREDSPNRDIFILASDGTRETSLIENPANDVLLGWPPDGRSILFASDRTGSMGAWMMEVADGKPLGSPALVKPDIGQLTPIGFTRKGSFYFQMSVGMRDVYVADLDPVTGRILGQPARASERFIGSNDLLDWSPDGQYLAYLSRRGHALPGEEGAQVIVIRSAETGQEREVPLKPTDIAIRGPLDGKDILVAGPGKKGRFGLYRIDAVTGEIRPLLQAEPGGGVRYILWGPTWSADGKTIFYMRKDFREGLSRILVRDLETGQDKELYRPPESSFVGGSLALSPDGRQLVLVVEDDVHSALMVMPSAGGKAHEILRLKKPEAISAFGPMAWTRDGRLVLFGKIRNVPGHDKKAELWKIPAEGGQPESAGLTMDGLNNLRVHPEGRRVAFNAAEEKYEVWVMEDFLPALRASR